MSKLSVSDRGARVAPFIAMDMMREANQLEATGNDIVHMEVGQPSSAPPRQVVEAAKAALDVDRIGYTNALGIPALRERISRHYADAYGLSVPAERVVITTGSSAGFILAFLAAFEPGAQIALPMPGYPAYKNILAALDLGLVPLETSARTRWAPDVDDIRRLAAQPDNAISGLLVASPANPTGTMLSPAVLKEIAQTCEAAGVRFLSDEIYHGLVYGMEQACALSYSDEAVIINSFSKYFCMTGWRIGWMIVPEPLLRPVECLAQSLYISAPTLSQHAALAAFDAVEELEGHKQMYARNREMLLNELPGVGFSEFTPVDGAFYVYADVARFTNDSFEFAGKMLREIGVATTPGADFDAELGHRFIRMSFAGSEDQMHEAVKRLRTWLP
ncbi:MAG: aminotransferase class I/II-fold pyridoxal phosphate-dependent enzyme [Alphaproteobacteria bacterium]|nr:aminotransferase class I/II-fold pyridoxal phosphate-dependent enzyme [Alphaproteobacteria bacterium]